MINDTLYPIVILAGGLATRLRPVTTTMPKSLMPVQGEPFISHQLRLLAKNNIRDVILCIGYLGEMIEQVVADGSQFGLKVRYVKDGPTLLGTGGALKQAAAYVDSACFVLYGDSYLDCDYRAVQHAFLNQQKLALMTVFRNEGQWDKSNIEFADDKIITYDKVQCTKQMKYIDYGLGVISKQALAYIPEHTSYDLAKLYQNLLGKKQLAGFEVKQRFYEVGSFAGISDLEYYLSQNQHRAAVTD